MSEAAARSTVPEVTTPVFYSRLPAAGGTLRVDPALASWDKAGSPGQARSAAFIDDAHALIADPIRLTPDPLALRLDVGLPATVPLTALNDLDNYAYPLVPKLTSLTGRQFACVWVTKHHEGTSSVSVSTAVPASDPGGTYSFEVTTEASASTTAYKKQIRDQVTNASPLAGNEVALQLAFVVGPRRSWANLWKATIDSLGPILGRDTGAGEWNALDGRITDLGLHCTVDPEAGSRVTIAIRASATNQEAVQLPLRPGTTQG